MNFQQLVEAEKKNLAPLLEDKKYPVPTSFAEALRFAADLVERTEDLERELKELQSTKYPEVLQSSHIMSLMGWSKSKLSEEAKDPAFPHLDKSRKRGEKITVLKVEFFHWLKNRERKELDYGYHNDQRIASHYKRA